MRLQADAGVSPVVAVVLLMGLVAIAGAIIGLSMVAALEDAAGTLPDVRFQASADNQSLYHAGGDALPLGSLVFYNTATRQSLSSVQLTKNGQNTAEETSLAGEVWETGDKITFGADVLKALSIIGLDSRNHPALLYRGVDAAVLPIGDMVPDAWKETTPTPIGPTPVPTPDVPGVVPTPVPTGAATDLFHQHDSFTFGNMEFDGTDLEKIIVSGNPVEYELSGATGVMFNAQSSNYKWSHVNVSIYDTEGKPIPIDPHELWVEKNKQGSFEIPSEKLHNGYIVHVTFSRWDDNTKTYPTSYPDFRQTMVIRIKTAS